MDGLVCGSGARALPNAGEFSKICKMFLKKFAKFLAYFSKNLQNNALNFGAPGRKTIGREIFENFRLNFNRKIKF